MTFFMFIPKFGEDDTHFDEHIFQMGWFNHQPVIKSRYFRGDGFSNNQEFSSRYATFLGGPKTCEFLRSINVV